MMPNENLSVYEAEKGGYAVVTKAPFVLGRFPTKALADAFAATIRLQQDRPGDQAPFNHGNSRSGTSSPKDVGAVDEIEWTEELERELKDAGPLAMRELSARLGLPISILTYHRHQLIAQAAAGETA